jgi:hypothetical protein
MTEAPNVNSTRRASSLPVPAAVTGDSQSQVMGSAAVSASVPRASWTARDNTQDSVDCDSRTRDGVEDNVMAELGPDNPRNDINVDGRATTVADLTDNGVDAIKKGETADFGSCISQLGATADTSTMSNGSIIHIPVISSSGAFDPIVLDIEDLVRYPGSQNRTSCVKC